MTGLSRFVSLACAAFLLAGSASAEVYTGSLSYPAGTGMIVSGQGNGWLTGITFDWTVSDEQAGAPAGYEWYYEYEVSVAKFAPRRLLIETGPSFTAASMTGVQLTHIHDGGAPHLDTALTTSVGLQQPAGSGNSNPGMPADVYGILFDGIGTGSGDNEVVRVSFWSNVAPAWGDFYTRCDGNGNRSYNLGFTTTDTDPSSVPSSGSVLNHILTPHAVPEPGIVALFAGVGVAGLARRKRAGHRMA